MHSIHIARLRVPLLDVIHVATNAHGVLRVSLCDDGDTLAKELRARYPNAVLKRGGGLSVDAGRAIKRYLAGGPDPRLPTVFPTEGFQARVWKQIARIPHGPMPDIGSTMHLRANPDRVYLFDAESGARLH